MVLGSKQQWDVKKNKKPTRGHRGVTLILASLVFGSLAQLSSLLIS